MVTQENIRWGALVYFNLQVITILFVLIIDLPNDERIKYSMEYLFHKKEVKIDNNVPLYLRRYQEIPFRSYALSFLKAEIFGIQKGSPLSRC